MYRGIYCFELNILDVLIGLSKYYTVVISSSLLMMLLDLLIQACGHVIEEDLVESLKLSCELITFLLN